MYVTCILEDGTEEQSWSSWTVHNMHGKWCERTVSRYMVEKDCGRTLQARAFNTRSIHGNRH